MRCSREVKSYARTVFLNNFVFAILLLRLLCLYSVDASESGEGSLEILVKSTSNGQHSLPTHVESLGNAVFAVSFTPDTSADHLIHVTFNEENVPGNMHKN